MEVERILRPANTARIITADFEDVVSWLSCLDAAERESALKVITRRFSDRAWNCNVPRRISLVRILVGLLPESCRLLERLLESRSDYIDFEIHFTLFCYLEWTCILPELRQHAERVLSLTRSYMLDATSAQARAVWMAGHMVGDHWEEIGAATSTLLDIVGNAKRPVARLAAIDGIEHLRRRLESPDTLLSSLSQVGKTDKSRRVKEAVAALIART